MLAQPISVAKQNDGEATEQIVLVGLIRTEVHNTEGKTGVRQGSQSFTNRRGHDRRVPAVDNVADQLALHTGLGLHNQYGPALHEGEPLLSCQVCLRQDSCHTLDPPESSWYRFCSLHG